MNTQQEISLEDIKEMIDRVNKNYKSQLNTDKCVISITYIDTDLGMMIAGATEKGICMLEFPVYRSLELELKQLISSLKAPLVKGDNIYFGILREQLNQYFKGTLREFDIPLDMVGTDFQKEAWLALLQIPYGSTSTYGKQAELIGKPSAVRAVANANGKNKISIILPCHRVIGSDGSLTGYGGEIWRKKRLLDLELGIKMLL